MLCVGIGPYPFKERMDTRNDIPRIDLYLKIAMRKYT